MTKIWYDGDIKKVDHGDWQEWFFPSGMRYTEGNIPEEEQFEFYGRYNPKAARIKHRGSPEELLALAKKQMREEKNE